VQAVPKQKDGPFQSVRVGFKGRDLSVIEIIDSFGQHSLLEFTQLVANAAEPAELFKFVVPAGADVLEQ